MALFDWIPLLQGKYLTYYQIFAGMGSTVCILLSLICFLLWHVLTKKQINKEKAQNIQSQKQLKNSASSWHKIRKVLFCLGFCFLSLIPLICMGLDVIGIMEGIFGMFSILLIMIYLNKGLNYSRLPYASLRNQQSTAEYFNNIAQKTLKTNWSVLKKQILAALIATIALNLFFYKTCLCYYNIQIGYYNRKYAFGINTCFTRLFQVKQSCPRGAPCQMYATIPQNPTQAFFLNVHTHPDVQEIMVFYQQLDTSNVGQFKNVTADMFPYLGLQWKAKRNVHSALITGLKPNTKYLTKIFYNNQFWTNAIYKTLPSDPNTPIRIINAGDSGYTQPAVNLSKKVATLKPDIFIMGGDIAYDNNMPACAYTWDYFLGMYGRITSTIGYMMPIVAIVGNHDVGLNQLPMRNITIDNYGPAFFIYFPQHYDRNMDWHIIQRVPPIKNRRTMMSYQFGNIVYIALDTGYIQLFQGFQKQFIIDVFQNNKEKIKFAGYHVPIYSVCDPIDRWPFRFLFSLFHWVPIFDKYHVMTIYQNHVHAFKRTKPLIGSTPKQNGTVYVGDGAYGALIQQMCNPQVSLGIFQTFSQRNNFWLTQIRGNVVQHWAYDAEGYMMDHFVQDFEGYKYKSSQHE